MTPLFALTIFACFTMGSFCLLAGAIVHRTGTTAGITDIARAIGGLLWVACPRLREVLPRRTGDARSGWLRVFAPWRIPRTPHRRMWRVV